MTIIKNIKEELPKLKVDERQAQVNQTASWYSFVTILVAYIVLGGIYILLGKNLPGSTVALFYVALFAFAYINIKNEGYHFIVPGMKETDTTLDQPAAIRSVPWLIVVSATVAFIFGNLLVPLSNALHHVSDWKTFATALVVGIIGFWFDYFVASRIKRGSKFFVRITQFLLPLVWFIFVVGTFTAAVYLVAHPAIEASFKQYVNNHHTSSSPLVSPFFVMNTLISVWVWIASLKYGRRMIEDGKSFKK